jgi:ankyrin repeat protein
MLPLNEPAKVPPSFDHSKSKKAPPLSAQDKKVQSSVAGTPLSTPSDSTGTQPTRSIKDVTGLSHDAGEKPLIKACLQGDEKMVARLLKEGASPKVEDKSGLTPLMIACNLGKTGIVKLLCQHPEGRESIGYQTAIGSTALMQACSRGDVEMVAALLDAGANLREMSGEGFTPLMAACFFGKTAIVKLLLQYPEVIESINQRDVQGETALFKACALDPEIVAILLNAGADLREITSKGSTPLMSACSSGKTAIVKQLLQYAVVKASINQKNRDGETALIRACFGGDPEMVAILLSAGANLQEAAVNGITPLMAACLSGKTDVVKLICQFREGRASIGYQTANGETALMKACYSGDPEMVTTLLNAGANLQEMTADGKTPLIYASYSGKESIVKVLCQDPVVKASINHHDINGVTALIQACMSGNARTVAALLEAGADPQITFDGVTTPLMVACQYGKTDIVKLLCQNPKVKASINHKDKSGKSALIRACGKGDAEMVAALIEAGADLQEITPNGWTPLMFACYFEKTDIVKLLCRYPEIIASINHKDKSGNSALTIGNIKPDGEIVTTLLKAGADPIKSTLFVPEAFGIQPTREIALERFTQLEENWWRQFIDGYYLPFGPMVFDEGRHNQDREPGYLQSFKKGFLEAQQMIDSSPSEKLYQRYHSILCDHFTGDESTSTLMGRDRLSEYRWLDTDASVKGQYNILNKWFNRLYEERFFDELRYKFKPPMGSVELVNKVLENSNLGKITSGSTENPIDPTFLYTKLETSEISQRMNKLFADYNQEMLQLNKMLTNEQSLERRNSLIELKLRSIANLYQQLEWLHPFQDGQGRTDLLLLSQLLCKEGFNPAILSLPYISTITTLNEWVTFLKLGMAEWRACRDFVGEIEEAKAQGKDLVGQIEKARAQGKDPSTAVKEVMPNVSQHYPFSSFFVERVLLNITNKPEKFLTKLEKKSADQPFDLSFRPTQKDVARPPGNIDRNVSIDS